MPLPVPDADPNQIYPPTHVFYVVDSEGVPSRSKLYLHHAGPRVSAEELRAIFPVRTPPKERL